MTRIRVLRVIARMNVGGPALQVSSLMRGLSAADFDHRLLVGEVATGEEDFIALRAPDLEAKVVQGLGRRVRPTADWSAYRSLRKAMREFRPHIVHTHTAKAGVLGRLAAQATDVPFTVHTFHGHLLHGYFGAVATRAVIEVERRLARNTDVLVAVGAQVRDDLLRAGVGSPGQYRVVPPGISLASPPSRRDARAELCIEEDRPVVAFVARLTPIKRPDRAVEAMRLVAQRHPDVLLLVAGEGPLLGAMVEAAASAGIGLRALGWRRDVERIYAAADVALLASDNEGTPVSLIEAALCGLPAVATDVGSVRDVVQPGITGLVCDVHAGALADAVTELLEDPTRASQLGFEGRRQAEARFGAARLVSDMEGMYRALIEEAR